MRRMFWLTLSMAVVLLASCDIGFLVNTTTTTSTTTTTTVAPTALQVNVHLGRSIDPVDDTTSVTWYFDINHNGLPIDNSAVVRVNSTNVPARTAFSVYYTLEGHEGATYVPGAMYTIEVTYGGNTYTEVMQAPGGISVTSDHSQVSWLYGGGFSVISANYTFGAGTYQMPGSLGALTSPHTIPASAYPVAGNSYDLNINIGSYKNGFGTLHGIDCFVWMSDYTRRRFNE